MHDMYGKIAGSRFLIGSHFLHWNCRNDRNDQFAVRRENSPNFLNLNNFQ